MTNPFLPLTKRASFNAIRIMDIPGADFDPAVRGQTAYDLVSARALSALIRANAERLRLPAEKGELPRLLNACFSAPDPVVRTAAAGVAHIYGQRLGAILLALRRGDPVNRAVRPDWEAAHWQFWGSIRQVWLGGGLVSGALGPLAAQAAADVLVANGFSDTTVQVSPYGAALPVLGVARCIPSRNHAGLVFDFGQSFIKRAVAVFQGGVLTNLVRLSDLQSTCEDHEPGEWSRAYAQRLSNSIAVVIAATRAEVTGHDVRLHPLIAASMACYLDQGQPEPENRGCYNPLAILADSYQDFLAAQVSARTGTAVLMHLLHDGTAAALVYAGQRDTAVLSLGTAVGVGFPPPTADGLRPLAERVTIRKA